MSNQKRPAWVVNMREPSTPMAETMLTVAFLPMSNLSTTAETKASIMEMEEEIPAITRHRKNMAPNMGPPGMRLTALGYATKARPMLCETTSAMFLPWEAAMKPSTEKTAKPAKSE